MKVSVKHLLLLSIILVVTASCKSNNLDEDKRWLKFYNLEERNFRQVAPIKQETLNWESYNLTNEYKKLYDTLYFYSPDSTNFLDLDSYNIILDHDLNGNLIWSVGDPEDKVQLVKSKDLSATTLLFFGTNGFAETAIWRNKYQFEIFGFRIKSNVLIPTIWKYDIQKNISEEFESTKTFNSRNKNYSEEVRLKTIKKKI